MNSKNEEVATNIAAGDASAVAGLISFGWSIVAFAGFESTAIIALQVCCLHVENEFNGQIGSL